METSPLMQEMLADVMRSERIARTASRGRQPARAKGQTPREALAAVLVTLATRLAPALPETGAGNVRRPGSAPS